MSDASACPVPFPPLDANKHAIASILGALDDKIDLNRRMNETLEAMARAIFKDWFVDFGPTRAKMEGRAPYLAPEIWALFPDRLDDEGKPEGWRTERSGELARTRSRERPLRQHRERRILEWRHIRMGNVDRSREPCRDAFDQDDGITDAASLEQARRVVHDRSTVSGHVATGLIGTLTHGSARYCDQPRRLLCAHAQPDWHRIWLTARCGSIG